MEYTVADPEFQATGGRHLGHEAKLVRHAQGEPGRASQPFAGAQVSRVLRCRGSDPGYDHTMSTEELSFDQRGLPVMSLVRVHNLSVSLDGFGAGADQSLEAPFGHAGSRLVRWFMDPRTFH